MLFSNLNTYLAIAKDSLAASKTIIATNRRPKPNGEPGFIITFDPDQKSFKRTLVNGISVSPDGKTLTVAQQGVNAKKETVKNTLVFDKQ